VVGRSSRSFLPVAAASIPGDIPLHTPIGQQPPAAMDSVEVDRMILLGKADTAYRAEEDAKALRILQRVLAQTSTKHPATAVPVVLPTPEKAQQLQREEPSADGALPLLAPALHSALGAASSPLSSSSSSSIVLPTPSEPPLFLLYHNIGLVQLRARKMHLARVYMTRALEAAQALTSSIAPASNGTASKSSFLSPPTKSRSLASSPTAGGRSLLQPPSPNGSAASPRSPSHSVSGSSSESSPHLVNFLLAKQQQVFANTGLVLLQAHTATSALEDDPSDTEQGLQLAARCFRHALHLQATPRVEKSTNAAILHVRLAECVLALYERERARQQSSAHPLLHSQFLFSPTSDLDEAVLHLRAALVEIQQNAASESSTQLQLACQIKLAHALGESQRHQEVIMTLTPLLPSLHATSSASVAASALAASPQLLLQAEFYAASSLIALAREQDASQLLARSTVPAVISARKLAASSTAPLTGESTLRFLSLMVYIAMVQRRDADARRLLEHGLKVAPRDATLLQQVLVLESRQDQQRQVEPIWLLKTAHQQTTAARA
jgi:hypothetical protein